MVIENPFGGWQVGWLGVGDGVPLSVLVQAALTGTVDDRIPEHAEGLFDALTDNRATAVRRLIGYGDFVYKSIKDQGATVIVRADDGTEREVVLV
ncbi:MAG: hypothetical protein ACRDTG_29135 [Pseudonocardiaceae bacterium]